MRRLRPGLGLMLLALLPTAGAARAAEVALSPYFALSEEFNDNIREQPSAARSELVTRVQPGASLSYRASDSLLDAAYNLDFRYYARHTEDEQFSHNAALKLKQGLLGEFLTLEASDNYARVPLDLTRDTTQESVLVNQTDQNSATVSPYLAWRPGGGLLKTGYRFGDVRYWHSATAIDKQSHAGFVNYTRKLFDRVELDAGYLFSVTDADRTRYRQHDVSAGLRYQYGANSFLFGSLGHSWLEFSGGRDTKNLFWDAGITQEIGRAVATLETRVQYSEDPLSLSTRQTEYSFRLDQRLARGTLFCAANYSKWQETLIGAGDRKRVLVQAGGTYELSPRLKAGLNLTGDRVNKSSAFAGLPYHLAGTGSLSWALGQQVSLTGSYTRVSYRSELDQDAGSIEVNRAVVELRTAF